MVIQQQIICPNCEYSIIDCCVFYNINLSKHILQIYIIHILLFQYSCYIVIRLWSSCIEMCIIEMNCLSYFLHILRKVNLFTTTIHDINVIFHTHIVHTEFGKRSIKYKGCNLWNNLPDDIKAIRSCCSFKVKLKKLLLQLLE